LATSRPEKYQRQYNLGYQWLSFEILGLPNAKNVKKTKFEALNKYDFEIIYFS